MSAVTHAVLYWQGCSKAVSKLGSAATGNKQYLFPGSRLSTLPMQATGAIQPSAAAIRRTLLQQGQVGLLLACGLSGGARPALGTGLFTQGAACRLRARPVACDPTSMLSKLWRHAGTVAGEKAHNQSRQRLA